MRMLCYFFIVTKFSKDEGFILAHGFRGFFPWSWPWPHCCELWQGGQSCSPVVVADQKDE